MRLGVRADHLGSDDFMNRFFLLVFGQLCSVCVSVQDTFRNVTEWAVPDVVEQSGVLHKLHLVGIQTKCSGHRASHVGDAQSMIEPRVNRARIDEVGKGELTDSTQSLKCVRPDQLHLLFSQGDKVVHWVADIHFHRRSPRKASV
jgi:hypothetical protein